MLKNYPYRDQDAGSPGGGPGSAENFERLESFKLERDMLEQTVNVLRKKGEMAKTTYNEIMSLSESLSKMAQDEAYFQEKSNEMLRSEADLLSAKAANDRAQFDLLSQINHAEGKHKEFLVGQLTLVQQQNEGIDAQLAKRDKVNEQLGIMDNLLLALDKIPFIGELQIGSTMLRAMSAELIATGSMVKALGAGFKILGKAIMQALPAAMFAAAIASAIQFSARTTEIGRELGISRDAAQGFGRELQLAAASSGDLLATSQALMEANSTLNELRGTAVEFSKEELIQSNRLLKTNVLSAEALTNFSQIANLNGKTIRETTEDAIAGANAAMREGGVRMNMKKILDETSKVSGTIRAQLGGNNEAIAKSVALAKQFGMELSAVAQVGKSLLQFETSINAELQAELFTGRQLNLERARLAALTGDYDTLTKEINANVGDFYEFSQLNVIQQEKLAAAFGMSSDQLSDILLKEADLEAMKKRAIADGDETTLQNLEQLSVQEKLTASLDRFKSVAADVLSLIIPIVEGFANFVSFIAESETAMYALGAAIAIAGTAMLINAVAGIFASFAVIPVAGPILAAAAIAGMFALIDNAKSKMEDGVIGPGGETIVSGPKGTIQVDKDDSMLVGTNLFGARNNESSAREDKLIELLDIIAGNTGKSTSINMMHSAWQSKDVNAVEGDNNSDTKRSNTFR